MALSAPPPPPDPPSSSTTTTTRPTATTTTTATRPPTPQPHPFTIQSSPSAPTQQRPPPSNYPQLAPKPPTTDTHTLLYPVASSGRGFLPKPAPNRPSRPPFALTNHSDPLSLRPAHSTPLFPKGFPPSLPKSVSAQPSVSDCNGFRDGRDKSKDDTIAIIRDRKIRVTDNASLYSLCRSWLKNSLPDETQSQYLDNARSLPRPLPLAPQDAESPVNKEGDKEEEKEDEGSVEDLSPKELLQRHVKRAKKIRSRLREERLRRIARYKTRLALLLPPMVEQQYRNDPAPGN